MIDLIPEGFIHWTEYQMRHPSNPLDLIPSEDIIEIGGTQYIRDEDEN